METQMIESLTKILNSACLVIDYYNQEIDRLRTEAERADELTVWLIEQLAAAHQKNGTK